MSFLLYATIFIGSLIVASAIIYVLEPWRNISVNVNYEYYYSELVSRVDTLIGEYSITRFDYDDLISEKRITTVEYNDMVKKTYKHVMSLIPSFILNNLYEYIPQEEVETLVLYRINNVYQKHYGGYVYTPEDLLSDTEATIKDRSFDVNGNEI